VDAIERGVPGADVAPITTVVGVVRTDPLFPHRARPTAAVATPELVAALDLGDHAGDLAAGRALVLDPSALSAPGVADGTVRIDRPRPTDGPEAVTDGAGPVTVDAVAVQRRRLPQMLPAVLLPESVVAEPGWSTWPVEDAGSASVLVVDLGRPARPADVAAVDRAVASVPDPGGALDDLVPLGALGGDETVGSALAGNRLDDSVAVLVETRRDVRMAAVVAGVVAVVALAVALHLAALTARADDDLLELVGAGARTVRAASAGQALVLAGLAVPIGVVAGVAATRAGISAYGTSMSRLVEVGESLPPVPVVVPGELAGVAVVVPLVAALVAWLTSRRRPLDLTTLPDRLSW
jgi:hypothetical protein